MPKKIIVIGGGIGGLSGAIRLAKMGYDVHLYEKNKMLGGKMGRICREGFTFDTGPTLLTMPFVVEELFQFAGFDAADMLQITPVEPVCRYFFRDSDPFDASADQKTMQRNLMKRFPKDMVNYQRFMHYAERIYNKTAPVFIFSPVHEIRKLLKWQVFQTLLTLYQIDPFRTVHQSVKRHFQDPRLVQLFDRYPTYNGSNPYRAPATLNVIPYVELGLGGYYIKGGLYSLVESMQKAAKTLNVKIHTETEVERICHDNHRIQGVSIHGEKIDADAVLCNADVVTSHHDLIDGFQKKAKRLGRLEPSLSGLIFFWGIRGEHPNLGQHNIFFSQDYQKEFTRIFQDLIPSEDPTVYVSISSKSESRHAPEGCENWFVLVNMPYLNENQSDENELTNRIRQAVLQKLKTCGLDIEKNILIEKTITPRDIAIRFRSNRGSIYGISSNTLNSAFKRPPNRSRQLRGLYFAGGSTHPGGGVPMCMLSGKIAAELINEFESR
ncbi:phytoene desaturase [bacterium]|nr:phytoene desaturase [bacterium]